MSENVCLPIFCKVSVNFPRIALWGILLCTITYLTFSENAIVYARILLAIDSFLFVVCYSFDRLNETGIHTRFREQLKFQDQRASII